MRVLVHMCVCFVWIVLECCGLAACCWGGGGSFCCWAVCHLAPNVWPCVFQIEDFESELHNLRQRMSQPGPMVGSKEEMQTLIHNTNKMAAFCKEITSITAVWKERE